ncbi:MAG: glycerol-3-phosphate 1-O-acyltransferase PlsY [Lactobacillaceae bacterium]|jgi:glycerol-3-phosphate acyltransferase PlsY|nr:glycerol-3-phosphate 1-O-acyltransferase PlsY [Lactobacillaceae bacterium]
MFSESFALYLVICAVFGYLLGSIPFGIVITKLAGYGDLRKVGPGTIGATNVLRATGSKSLTLLTILLDAFKAGGAAALAYILCEEPFRELFLFENNIIYMTTHGTVAALTAGVFAILGHSFPVWLKFKGGKGVASAFGLILVLSPAVAVLALGTWILVAVIFRYSSLSAITAAALTPLYAWFFAGPAYTLFYTPIVILILVRHRTNIMRLIRGEESKITFKKKN